MDAVLLVAGCLMSASGGSVWEVAVPEFAVSSKAAGDAWNGRAVAVLVSGALDVAAPYKRVLHAESLAGERPRRHWRAAEAARIGRLTLAKATLLGRISFKGGSLVVSCRLVSTCNGKVIGHGEFYVQDIFDAAKKTVTWIVGHVSEARGVKLPTENAEALRLYCRAISCKRSELDARCSLLQAAVEADGAFPQALDEFVRALSRRDEHAKAILVSIRLGCLPGWAGRANLLKGRISERRGQFGHAQQYYEQAGEDDQQRPMALYRLASLANRRGETAKAEALCLEALAADRSTRRAGACAPAANLLGVIDSRRNASGKAIEWYRRAIAADPLWDKPHDNLAVVLEDQGDIREAAAEFRKAIELNPDNVRCLRRLATILAGGWHYDAAIKYAKRAVDLAPTSADTVQTLGAVYYHAGETDDALRELLRAIKIDPRHAKAHYTIGLTHELDGDIEQAVISYRRALQINPALAECAADLERCERQMKAERLRARRSFSCARIQSGSGDPAGLTALLLCCMLPALVYRLSRVSVTRHNEYCPFSWCCGRVKVFDSIPRQW